MERALNAYAPASVPGSGLVSGPPRLPPEGLRPDPRPLGEILIELGYVSPAGLAEALSVQHLEDERVGETLVRLKHCSDWQVCQALARQFALPALESLPPAEIDDELAERLPIGYARGNMLLPRKLDLPRDGQAGVLQVLASDPTKLLEVVKKVIG